WLAAMHIFPVATTAMARLVRGSLPARLGAGLLYVVNPFFFDRLYAGQLGLLAGLALLPFAVRALLDAAADARRVARAACWSAVVVAADEHFAWILVPVVIAIAVTRSRPGRAARGVGLAGAGAAAASTYMLVPPLLLGFHQSGAAAQLAAYRTAGDPRVGLAVNVLGLYGFFRPVAAEPKYLFAGWPAVLGALLVVVAAGLAAALRDPQRRRDALAFLLVGVAGFFLALGARGPTGAAFRFAYLHVPGLAIMRESEKFSVLLLLSYCVAFAWGVEQIGVGGHRQVRRWLPLLVALALPVAYTPNLFGGLGGHVHGSEAPAAWGEAARLVGDQASLVLPWHQYFATPLAGGRVVSNPAAFYFRGPVVEGGDPGPGYAFGPEDHEHRLLDRLLTSPLQTAALGADLRSLGVRWIVLEKAADWRSYQWVEQGLALRPVLTSPTLDLFSLPRTAGTESFGRVARRSPVRYLVRPGPVAVVALPVTYAPGWALGGRPGVELPDGLLGVRSPAEGGVVTFQPFGGVLAAELGSVGVVAALVGLAWHEGRRGRRRRGAGSSGEGR
ncbi:MAG: hypothetical protein ACYDEN_07435, partial [Acidimicrobiales bacterium]